MMLDLQIIVVTAIVLSTSAKEVCFPELGCFSNDAPFNNTAGQITLSPDELPVNILLFTRQQKTNGQTMSYNDKTLAATLSSAHFDPSRDTKLIAHGFGGSVTTDWLTEMKDALLEKGDFNVFIIGWEKGAAMPDYFQAVANILVVAAKLQVFLENLQTNGLDLGKVHLIGHSLGAQLFGAVGRRMNGVVGRISALDAAEPSFENLSPEVRLDKSDAKFVDVIHTNGDELNLLNGGFGIYQPSGHVDFYVNGGKKQPGCCDGLCAFVDFLFSGQKRDSSLDIMNKLSSKVSCSHHRSVEYFIESIKSDCKFTAYPCASYEAFKRGECNDCSNNSCNEMGFHADPAKGSGSLYLKTNRRSPFCVASK